ncbi:cation:proton antiporter [Sphingobacterium corticibacter]|uniref:Cation/H(+) antiporter n=1 Tax=Sphingobacterium corticibacter TaxID=2171749 RepID=A0A2T8HHZ7_9SPHI|nr:cation:proton antiporter [Sphingobacterium corticibacter]PVH25067.1 cation/H(+) antiporter [Sphingobacterium corticibacter]
MKNLRSTVFYIAIVIFFSFFMYWIIQQGSALESGRDVLIPTSENGAWADFVESLKESLQYPLSILLIQIVAIILTARLFGWICVKIKQPVVIGEMLAGIILGPSLLGLFFPDFFSALFPAQSLGNLQFLSQIGLILFMFIVGMELDLHVLRNKAHDAVVISHASIMLPFTLGIGLAYFLYENHAPQNVQFLSYSLFIGIAMSITAFPVLARIVQERGLQKTRLGTVVITCAAADDITAWCILAVVIAIVKAGSFVSALYTIGLALAYVLTMIKIVRPFFQRIGQVNSTKETLSKPVVAIFFLMLILSAYTTEVIGIHALFGAFMAGAIMPENNKFRNLFIEKIEDVALVLLLPLFFVFTGLRTQIGLLNDPSLWLITGLIILVAVVGKFVGSALAARFMGQGWKDSLSIGALMNTRGLMELVVLNIGYDLSVLSAELFSMMVVMALVTTFMTGPALDLINWIFRDKAKPTFVEKIESQFNILFSFGKTESGQALLRLSNALTAGTPEKCQVAALHVSPANELHHYEVEEQETECFRKILDDSRVLKRPIKTLFRISSDIDHEIVDEVETGQYDMLLIGTSESIYEGSLLGKIIGFTSHIIHPEKLFASKIGVYSSKFYERTNRLLSKVDIPVGVLIDKGLEKIDQVVMPIFFKEDLFLLDYVNKLIGGNPEARLILWDVDAQFVEVDLVGEVRSQNPTCHQRIDIFSGESIGHEKLLKDRLILISLVSWETLLQQKRNLSIDPSSELVIRDRIIR